MFLQFLFLVVPYTPQSIAPLSAPFDPTGWYLFHLPRGVRVFWNGSTLQTSMTKQLIDLPVQLPSFAFEAIWTIHHGHPKLMVFDAPLMYGETFEQRFHALQQRID